jgi:hypothetical protein
MIKEEYMEKGMPNNEDYRVCRDCENFFLVTIDNKCSRESYRCEECNKNYSWFKIIYSMFF